MTMELKQFVGLKGQATRKIRNFSNCHVKNNRLCRHFKFLANTADGGVIGEHSHILLSLVSITDISKYTIYDISAQHNRRRQNRHWPKSAKKKNELTLSYSALINKKIRMRS